MVELLRVPGAMVKSLLDPVLRLLWTLMTFRYFVGRDAADTDEYSGSCVDVCVYAGVGYL